MGRCGCMAACAFLVLPFLLPSIYFVSCFSPFPADLSSAAAGRRHIAAFLVWNDSSFSFISLSLCLCHPSPCSTPCLLVFFSDPIVHSCFYLPLLFPSSLLSFTIIHPRPGFCSSTVHPHTIPPSPQSCLELFTA